MPRFLPGWRISASGRGFAARRTAASGGGSLRRRGQHGAAALAAARPLCGRNAPAWACRCGCSMRRSGFAPVHAGEDWARRLRYTAFAQPQGQGIDAIATAAETGTACSVRDAEENMSPDCCAPWCAQRCSTAGTGAFFAPETACGVCRGRLPRQLDQPQKFPLLRGGWKGKGKAGQPILRKNTSRS